MKYILPMLLLALAACQQGSNDYGAGSICTSRGYAKGTADFDKCFKEEKAVRMMEQQREQFEQDKQYDQDWKMRRGSGY